MSDVIRLLPDSVANQIAAGEIFVAIAVLAYILHYLVTGEFTF